MSVSLEALPARDTLAARPGTKFTYLNTGYMFAGATIEKVHGKSYAEALRDEIARPFGLKFRRRGRGGHGIRGALERQRTHAAEDHVVPVRSQTDGRRGSFHHLILTTLSPDA
jgi:CubicO group peptidase (beta-lactamase class C family)